MTLGAAAGARGERRLSAGWQRNVPGHGQMAACIDWCDGSVMVSSSGEGASGLALGHFGVTRALLTVQL